MFVRTESSDLTSMIVTEGLTSQSVSIPANGNGRAAIDISKTGYTFLGAVSVDITNSNLALQSFSLVTNTTEFRVYFYNATNSAQSVQAVIKALYVKNI